MFAGMSPCFFLVIILSLLNNIGTLAFPTPAVNDTSILVNDHALDSAVQLRILPLGASIMYGLKSSDGNGFRNALRNMLIANGNPSVDYVGSNHCGTMADNECEGWPGFTISQVAAKAELSIPSKPNLVLLHVGTNDAVQNVDIQHAGDRLGSLIDRLFDAIPGVTIVASTLLPNANPKTQANVKIYNGQIPVLSRNVKLVASTSFTSTSLLRPSVFRICHRTELILRMLAMSRWLKFGIKVLQPQKAEDGCPPRSLLSMVPLM